VFGQDVASAIAAPRIHHQWSPDRLVVEPALPADVQAALAKKGYPEVKVDDTETGIQAIRVRDDGTREAASEPRKFAAPAAQP
jgi:gamma-glutamyltranspeptidase